MIEFINHVCGRNNCLIRAIKPGYPTIDFLLSDSYQHQINECKRLNNRGYNIYFGVACRDKDKKPVAAQACWLDIDFKNFDDGIMNIETIMMLKLLSEQEFQPSVIVKSGHGLHAYWILNQQYSVLDNKDTIELVNKKLAFKFNGDRVHNFDRLMRLPGFLNQKNPDYPIPVGIVFKNYYIRYNLLELEDSLKNINIPIIKKQTEELIKGKNTDKFASRSERDFAAVIDMVKAGYLFDEVEQIFEENPIGDKYIQKGVYGKDYLEKTFNAASLAANVETEI